MGLWSGFKKNEIKKKIIIIKAVEEKKRNACALW